MCLLRSTDWVFIYYSTFCPHSVFMCFVWIWEQTAIISLYSTNWLVSVTETECVYCAVRTGSLYIIFYKQVPLVRKGPTAESKWSSNLKHTEALENLVNESTVLRWSLMGLTRFPERNILSSLFQNYILHRFRKHKFLSLVTRHGHRNFIFSTIILKNKNNNNKWIVTSE